MNNDFYGFFDILRPKVKLDDVYGMLKYRYNVDIDTLLAKSTMIINENSKTNPLLRIAEEVVTNICSCYSTMSLIGSRYSNDHINVIYTNHNNTIAEKEEKTSYSDDNIIGNDEIPCDKNACVFYIIIKTLIQLISFEKTANVGSTKKYSVDSRAHIQPHKSSPLSQALGDSVKFNKRGENIKNCSLKLIPFLIPFHIATIKTAKSNPYTLITDENLYTLMNALSDVEYADRSFTPMIKFYTEFKNEYQTHNDILDNVSKIINDYITEKTYKFNTAISLSVLWQIVNLHYSSNRCLLMFTNLDNSYESDFLIRNFLKEYNDAYQENRSETLDHNNYAKMSGLIENLLFKYSNIISYKNAFFYPCIFLTFYYIIKKSKMSLDQYKHYVEELLQGDFSIFLNKFSLVKYPDSVPELIEAKNEVLKKHSIFERELDVNYAKNIYWYSILFECCRKIPIEKKYNKLMGIGEIEYVEHFLHPTNNSENLGCIVLNTCPFITSENALDDLIKESLENDSVEFVL